MRIAEVTELRNIADVLEARSERALARRLRRIASEVESLVKPKEEARIHIRGLLHPILHHLLLVAEATARESHREELPHWRREMRGLLSQAEDWNYAPERKKGVYLSEKELEELSRPVLLRLKRRVAELLAEKGFDPEVPPCPEVERAEALGDLLKFR